MIWDMTFEQSETAFLKDNLLMIYDNKLYRITTIIISVILLSMTLGCVPKDVTDDYRDVLTKECVPMAREWFIKNVPEATVKSGDLFSDGYDCTKSVAGSYVIDNQEYRYWYNCDTDEMLSDASIGLASDYLIDDLSEEPYIAGFDTCEIHNLGFVYSVSFVNNRKNGWDDDSKAETQVTTSEVGMDLEYLPIFASESEIKEMVDERISKKQSTGNLWVTLYYAENHPELSDNELDELFGKYQGIETIRLVNNSTGESKDYKN